MTPIEAMAREICLRRYGDPDFDYGMNKPRWKDCVSDARAALDALADNVSEGMVEAGENAQDSRDPVFPSHIFRAMLKAAREEG